jgi:hypothetical protein
LILKPGKLKKNGEIGSFDPQVFLDTAGMEGKIECFGEANRTIRKERLRIP